MLEKRCQVYLISLPELAALLSLGGGYALVETPAELAELVVGLPALTDVLGRRGDDGDEEGRDAELAGELGCRVGDGIGSAETLDLSDLVRRDARALVALLEQGREGRVGAALSGSRVEQRLRDVRGARGAASGRGRSDDERLAAGERVAHGVRAVVERVTRAASRRVARGHGGRGKATPGARDSRGVHACLVAVGEALRPSPGALDIVVKVDPGEEVLLEVVEGAAGLDLVNAKKRVERLLGLAAVRELGEEQLSVLGGDGARSVAVVAGVGCLACERLLEVVDEHWRLRSDGGSSLAGGQAAGITDTPDIVESLVASCALVDIDKASTVSERALLDEGKGAHLGGNVHKVELLLDGLSASWSGKDGSIAVLDGDKVVLKETSDATLLAELVELGAVLGDTKHDRETGGKADRDGSIGRVLRVVEASLLPVVEGEPHDLLGSTGTLDHTEGLGEDGVSALELGDGVKDLVAGVVAVDGGDERVGVLKGLGETLDAIVVDAETGDDDKVVVGEGVTVGKGDGVLLGLELVDTLGVVLELGVKEALDWPAEVSLVLETTSDKGPTRLVVVPLGWVYDGNVILLEATRAEKLVADRGTGSSSADDNNLVAARAAAGVGDGGVGEGGERAAGKGGRLQGHRGRAEERGDLG